MRDEEYYTVYRIYLFSTKQGESSEMLMDILSTS